MMSVQHEYAVLMEARRECLTPITEIENGPSGAINSLDF